MISRDFYSSLTSNFITDEPYCKDIPSLLYFYQIQLRLNLHSRPLSRFYAINFKKSRLSRNKQILMRKSLLMHIAFLRKSATTHLFLQFEYLLILGSGHCQVVMLTAQKSYRRIRNKDGSSLNYELIRTYGDSLNFESNFKSEMLLYSKLEKNHELARHLNIMYHHQKPQQKPQYS